MGLTYWLPLVQLVRWDMSYDLGWCSIHFSGEKLKATAHVSANELYTQAYITRKYLSIKFPSEKSIKYVTVKSFLVNREKYKRIQLYYKIVYH
jgi:hypothetical protein